MRGYCRHLIFALIMLSIFSISYPVRSEILDAQWQVYQVRFYYTSFSTHYTCDGIERKLRRLLILMGARNDARVESACADHRDLRSRSVKRFQRAHRLKLAFAMPVPVDETDIPGEVISAEWQKVRIVGSLSRHLDGDDCELLAQFQHQVAPQLLVRSMKKKLHCNPDHRKLGVQRTRQRLKLYMTALMAITKKELEAGHNKKNKGG